MGTVRYLIYYLIAVNVSAFAAFGLDKWKAVHERWRIPEAALMGLAVFGGSVGALLGMKTFHHKTKHKKFTIGIPLILTCQIGIAAYLKMKGIV